MCPTSITNAKCYDKYCKLKHVKGTKWKQNEIKHSDPPKRPTNSNVGMPEEYVKRDKTVEQTNFLEVIRLLKAEILESMDIKLAMFMAQQQSYQKPQYQYQQIYLPNLFQLPI